MDLKARGIDRLSVDERITLIDQIWEGIGDAPEPPLLGALKAELDRRLAAHEANPGAAIPWETVRDRLLARSGRDTGWRVESTS